MLICRKNRDLELIYNNNTLYNNSVKNVEIILFEITYESRIITTLFSLLIFFREKSFCEIFSNRLNANNDKLYYDIINKF